MRRPRAHRVSSDAHNVPRGVQMSGRGGEESFQARLPAFAWNVVTSVSKRSSPRCASIGRGERYPPRDARGPRLARVKSRRGGAILAVNASPGRGPGEPMTPVPQPTSQGVADGRRPGRVRVQAFRRSLSRNRSAM
jgi:hypothetical protein